MFGGNYERMTAYANAAIPYTAHEDFKELLEGVWASLYAQRN
jgi:hypothetical protein